MLKNSSRFGLRVLGSGFWVQGSGFRVLGSAPPPVENTAGQIEKETLKKRITNIESSSGGL
jgi:hypothetical protein